MSSVVSIIIANFNKGLFIAETIQSVLKQTFGDWELIIIDDASNDKSLEVISSFFYDTRVKLIKNENNKGANYCRNEGIKHAKGRYIIFLDADDLLVSSCIEKRVEKANQNPEADFLVFTMGVFKETIGDTPGLWRPVSKKPLQDFLQHILPWSILQPIWKKEFLLSIKGFDLTFQRMQDVELSTRALLVNNVKYKQFDGEPDCYYRTSMERFTYNAEEFLKRFVDSCLLYCVKFKTEVGVHKKFYLTGTVLQTYLQLLHYCKKKNISTEQFVFLENRLLKNKEIQDLISRKINLFKLAKMYNLFFIRIPGINFILNKLIVS